MALANINIQDMVSIIFSLCWLIYTCAFYSSSYQATPGKRVLGVIVTDLQGQRISFGQAFGREFMAGVIGIIIIALLLMIANKTNNENGALELTYGIICCAMVAFTKKKQTLHDMVARTLVIKK